MFKKLKLTIIDGILYEEKIARLFNIPKSVYFTLIKIPLMDM